MGSKSTYYIRNTFFLLIFQSLLNRISANPLNQRNFIIGSNSFLKDGVPFQIISGSVQYFRLDPTKWEEILAKSWLAGLNTISTDVEWSFHQHAPNGTLDFRGGANLLKFIELAQSNNLYVILRIGPWIGAERDFGGIPTWLDWASQKIVVRSSNRDFLQFLSNFWDELLPRLTPYLYENGGPIILMQVENEYGQVGCDREYLIFLRDKIREHLGPNLALISAEMVNFDDMRCSHIPGVFPTVKFDARGRTKILESFAVQKYFSKSGPLMNSGLLTGSFDVWGQPGTPVTSDLLAEALDSILGMGASVDLYPFIGGSNFGFGGGAGNDPEVLRPVTTSYDCGAPLTEAGDPTEKFYALREVISKYANTTTVNPKTRPKAGYGLLGLKPIGHILDPDFLQGIPQIQSESPMTFNELRIPYGFVLYETWINSSTSGPEAFSAPEMKDRAYVYIGDDLQGILTWQKDPVFSIPINLNSNGSLLRVLVENQGRLPNGYFEEHGLGRDVSLGDLPLKGWTHYKIGEIDISNVKMPKKDWGRNGTFFQTDFSVKKTLDTFLDLRGWTRGIVWINGFNLGRYWSIGPQLTLYCPGSKLKTHPESNKLILLELEGAPIGCSTQGFNASQCSIISVDKPIRKFV